MSATEIQTEGQTLKTADRKALYQSAHSAGIKSAVAIMHTAEESLAAAQRAVGRVVSSAVAALLAVGASAEEAQKYVLADIGGDYSWSYVSSWQKAARVYDSLSEENQQRYGDSTESLKQLGRFSEEKRNEVATKLAKNGKAASVRDLRTAADKLKSKNGRKRNTTSGVETLVGKLEKVRKAVKTPTAIAGDNWTPAVQKFVTDMAEVAARAAKNGKALSKTETEAIAQLTYFGPKGSEDK